MVSDANVGGCVPGRGPPYRRGAILDHVGREQVGCWWLSAITLHSVIMPPPAVASNLNSSLDSFLRAGYVSGVQLSRSFTAEQVICWVLVISLPITLPLALWTRPTAPVAASAWAGFAYVSLISMWIGFFAWYRGLALGGTLRVSQVQVLQPFLSMLFSVPLLGEKLDAMTIAFALAVLAVVWLGKRQPVNS